MLIGIGVAAFLYHIAPKELATYLAWCKRRFPWILLIGGMAIIGLNSWVMVMLCRRAGIEPTRQTFFRDRPKEILPPWMVILVGIGVIAMAIGIWMILAEFFR